MFIRLFIFLFLSVIVVLQASSYSQTMKEKKIYPMGQKIHQKKCPHLEISQYASYDSLLQAVEEQHICGNLNTKYSEALSLYLWDKTRNHTKHYEKLTVDKKEKCPVCGMFLYKYPQWISRIYYDDKSFSFDGIKDMMKFYFDNKEGVRELLVQDYYTGKTIDAKQAYFVIGSDVYGPMGNELIAFDTLKSAKHFLLDHRGKKVIEFSEITPELVYKLDE